MEEKPNKFVGNQEEIDAIVSLLYQQKPKEESFDPQEVYESGITILGELFQDLPDGEDRELTDQERTNIQKVIDATNRVVEESSSGEVDNKAMSSMNETSGGAMVAPTRQFRHPKVKPSPFKR